MDLSAEVVLTGGEQVGEVVRRGTATYHRTRQRSWQGGKLPEERPERPAGLVRADGREDRGRETCRVAVAWVFPN